MALSGQNGQREELSKKTLQVCAHCRHFKWKTMQCDRQRSQCHSRRVRRWLEELGELESGR
jgi:hypothetical protein